MINTSDKITILGAGLAGSLLACMISEEGFKVEVIEKREDPRSADMLEGRSINLALSHRGIQALKYAGIYEDVEKALIPMKGRMMHDIDGNLTFQAYGSEGQSINSVSRNDLNCILINKAEERGVKFQFGTKCEGISDDHSEITLVNRKEERKTYKATVIIGADGAFSAVRRFLMKHDRFNYSQHYIDHGYKEFTMPPLNGEFAFEPNYLHIWPRGKYMMIALPNPDKSFTCTLFYPFDGEKSFSSIDSNEKVTTLFENDFKDLSERIPDYNQQYQDNPTSSLVTIKCVPWNYKNVLVIGDAAHAIVPFYGQGMNAAFEDCRLLMELTKEKNFEWIEIFEEFSNTRKKDADAIADLALRNFIEMRDEVADANFLERKKADALMHQHYKNEWIPMYTQVSFTDIPYDEALRSGNLQQSVLREFQNNNALDDLHGIMQRYRSKKNND